MNALTNMRSLQMSICGSLSDSHEVVSKTLESLTENQSVFMIGVIASTALIWMGMKMIINGYKREIKIHKQLIESQSNIITNQRSYIIQQEHLIRQLEIQRSLSTGLYQAVSWIENVPLEFFQMPPRPEELGDVITIPLKG